MTRYWRRNIVLYPDHKVAVAELRQFLDAKSDSAVIRFCINRAHEALEKKRKRGKK